MACLRSPYFKLDLSAGPRTPWENATHGKQALYVLLLDATKQSAKVRIELCSNSAFPLSATEDSAFAYGPPTFGEYPASQDFLFTMLPVSLLAGQDCLPGYSADILSPVPCTVNTYPATYCTSCSETPAPLSRPFQLVPPTRQVGRWGCYFLLWYLVNYNMHFLCQLGMKYLSPRSGEGIIHSGTGGWHVTMAFFQGF
jgi:hypothetical protein